MNFRKPYLWITSIFIIFFSIIYIFNLASNISSPYLIVHYINVGQGDAILIQVNNKNLLIDSGPVQNRKNLIDYLDSQKIKSFDYIIATHPHEDHIGNMSTVIKKYNISSFYAPKSTHTSKSFEKMVTSLVDKGLKINVIKSDMNKIDLGENVLVSVFSPPAQYSSENLNEYSPIIKIQYLNTSFLFTGDAEKSNEAYVLSQNYNLKADVIKIGHHGSNTSTSEDFLTAVNPSLAVISVGKNNKYNLPSKDTLNKLKENNIATYRTDISGTIVLVSDGNTIKRKNYDYSYK